MVLRPSMVLRLCCSALVCGVTLIAQTAPPAPSGAEPAAPTISVSARLVVVPVTIRDKKGVLVPNLHKEDFTLSEDGTPQTIRYFDHDNNAPLTLGLLVDVSGSQRTVLDDERTASSAFLDTLLQPDRDKAFIIQFGHQADLLTDVTTSLPKLQSGLKKIDPDTERPQFGGNGNGGSGSGGNSTPDPNDPQSSNDPQSRNNRRGRGGSNGAGTVMYDAIFLASNDVISKQGNRKAFILLTDGDDRGSKESIGDAIEAAQRADTAVYAIYYKGESPRDSGNNGGGGRRGGYGGGFPGGRGGGGGYPGGGGGNRGGGESRPDGKKILERIADETGGRVFTVSKKEPLADIYKQIAEELRSQYRLGFTPTDRADGYHKLLVDLPHDKKSTIQAREGYYTGKPAN